MAKRKIRTSNNSIGRVGSGSVDTLGANESKFVLSADIVRQQNKALDSASNLRRVKVAEAGGSSPSIEGGTEGAVPAKTGGQSLAGKKKKVKVKKSKKKGKVIVRKGGKSQPTELDAKAFTETDAMEALRLRTEIERLKNAMNERQIIEGL